MPSPSAPTPTCYSDEILCLGEHPTPAVCFPPSPPSALPRSGVTSLFPRLAFLCLLLLIYLSAHKKGGDTCTEKSSAPCSPVPPCQNWTMLTHHQGTIQMSPLLFLAAGRLRTRASVGKRNCHCSVLFSQGAASSDVTAMTLRCPRKMQCLF